MHQNHNYSLQAQINDAAGEGANIVINFAYD